MAYARPAAARRPPASVPVARRVLGSWHEPNTWTVGILLATGVAVLARHPIAHALGTEVDTPSTVAPAAAPAAPAHAAPGVPSLSLPVVPVPTHAPRDPFHALVVAGRSAVAAAPAAKPGSATAAATPAPPSVVPAAPAASCAATHRVQPGESLWTIAARATGSTDTGRVTLAWHRLYDANRAVIGPDPSVVSVGTSLCVPGSLSR